MPGNVKIFSFNLSTKPWLNFKCGPFILLSGCSSAPLLLIEEQYGKMEPKYPEVGHCQIILHPLGSLTSPFFINSVEMAVPYNIVSHPQKTVLLACYLDRTAQILLWFRVRERVPEL